MPNLMYRVYWKHQKQAYFNFRFYSYYYWFFLELFHPICYHVIFFPCRSLGKDHDSLYFCGWGLFMWLRAVDQTSLQWPNSPFVGAKSAHCIICELFALILTGMLWLRAVLTESVNRLSRNLIFIKSWDRKLNIPKIVNFDFSALPYCMNRKKLTERPWIAKRQKREEVGERSRAQVGVMVGRQREEGNNWGKE